MKLYKYLPMSLRTLEGLAKSQLWFSESSSFNDPFDCNLDEINQYSQADIEAFYNRDNNGNKVDTHTKQYSFDNPSELRESALKHRKNNIAESGVLCLSKSHDNLLMWAHYADSHKGIVLGFELGEDKDFFTHMFEVKYRDEYEPINFAKNGILAMNDLLQTKSSHWSYEEEFRILKRPDQIKNNNSRSFSYEQKSLTDIYFGLNTSSECVQIIKSIRTKNDACPIKFHKARKQTNEFKLLFDEMD